MFYNNRTCIKSVQNYALQQLSRKIEEKKYIQVNLQCL